MMDWKRRLHNRSATQLRHTEPADGVPAAPQFSVHPPSHPSGRARPTTCASSSCVHVTRTRQASGTPRRVKSTCTSLSQKGTKMLGGGGWIRLSPGCAEQTSCYSHKTSCLTSLHVCIVGCVVLRIPTYLTEGPL